MPMICPACGSQSPNPQCWHCRPSTVPDALIEAAFKAIAEDMADRPELPVPEPVRPTPPTPRSRGPRKVCPRCHEATGMATAVCMRGYRYETNVRRL